MPSHVGHFQPKNEDIECWIDRYKASLALNDYGEVQYDNDDAADPLAGAPPQGPAAGDNAAAVAAANAAIAAFHDAVAKDVQQRAFLIAEIGPQAYGTLQRTLLPATPMGTTVRTSLRTLRRVFKSTKTIETARSQFTSRFQTPSESIADYVQAIQLLASRCDFRETLNERLLERIKTGVLSANVFDALYDAPATTTYDDAVAIAIATEEREATKEAIKKMRAAAAQQQEGEAAQTDKEAVNRVYSRGRGYQSHNKSFRGRGGQQFQPRGRGQWQQDQGRSPMQSQRWQQDQGRNSAQTPFQPRQYGPSRGSLRYAPRLCYVCHRQGHMARECPNNQGDQQQQYASQERQPQQQRQSRQYSKKVEEEDSVHNSAVLTSDSERQLSESIHGLYVRKVEESDGVCEQQLSEPPYDLYVGKAPVKNLCDQEETSCVHFDAESNCSLYYDSSRDTWTQFPLDENLCDKNLCDEDLCDENLCDMEETSCVHFDEESNCYLYYDLSRDTWTQFPLFEDQFCAQIESAQPIGNKPLYTTILINNVPVEMEIDTGSQRSLINLSDFQCAFPNVEINQTKLQLLSVSGDRLNIVGEVKVAVKETNGDCATDLTLIVCDSDHHFKPLLGREWLNSLWPVWRDIIVGNVGQVCVEEEGDMKVLKEWKVKYPNCFDKDRSSSIKGFKANIILKRDAVPTICRAYSVPFGIRDQVEKQLRAEVEAGIAELITRPKWASPMFSIPKENGKFRHVIDFKKVVNPQLDIDYYPLHRQDELFVKVAGGEYYAVIDLSEAYLQIEVSPDSQDVLTVNTCIGFLKYKRLPYGLASAPALFQQMMDVMLKDLEGTCAYLDDVIVKGKDKQECTERVEAVLQRLHEHNVRLNVNKCQWPRKAVVYLGHKISKLGIETLDTRVMPILQCPPPENVTQLRSYLGMLNFYRKFLPDLSTLLAPLNELLKKDVSWEWSEDCQYSFDESKKLLCSNKVLAHYDAKKTLVLMTDASPYGISAVLSHREGKVERPILFSSNSLSAAQRDYSQIEREALAIVTAVIKFEKYLSGRRFILVTDNHPLKFILAPDKGLPTIIATRVKRWALTLGAYLFDVEYRKSSDMGPADALSRLPLPHVIQETVNLVQSPLDCFDEINYEIVAAESEVDAVLAEVMRATKEGWPNHCNGMNAMLRPYFRHRYAFSVEQGCLMYNGRVVIPALLQKKVLELLHKGHNGIVRTKMLARDTVWWLTLDADIEESIKNCTPCSVVNFRSASNITVPWPCTGEPWIRLHIDFFDFQGKKFLLLEDSYSKWIEVWQMPYGTTASHVIQKLRECFTIFGLPREIVADNGPPFASTEFIEFCTANHILLTNIAPHHPQSNGQAERSVQTVKRAFKKFMLSPEADRFKDTNFKIVHFLNAYRQTPSTVTGCAPAEILLNIKPRTLMTILKPPNDQDFQVVRSTRQFKVNDPVKIRMKPQHPVLFGKVVRVFGPTVYLCAVGTEMMRCHINQMQLCANAQPAQQSVPQPTPHERTRAPSVPPIVRPRQVPIPEQVPSPSVIARPRDSSPPLVVPDRVPPPSVPTPTQNEVPMPVLSSPGTPRARQSSMPLLSPQASPRVPVQVPVPNSPRTSEPAMNPTLSPSPAPVNPPVRRSTRPRVLPKKLFDYAM